MRYLGLDGCKAGWFMVGLTADRKASFAILPDMATLAPLLPDAELVLLDIPIGLRSEEPAERACDRDARQRLGPRRSSVFPAPARGVLDCVDYAAANARNRVGTGRGLSCQSWNIVPKIREVDAFLRSSPLRHKVREMHPELCFWALNGGRAMRHNKKTTQGYRERIGLLKGLLPAAPGLVKRAMARYPRKQLARDDIVDALVGAVTAALPGELRTLPDTPELDATGLPMEMVYRRV